MKAQSVLYNYITLLLREKKRTCIKFCFLKLTPLPLPSFITYFGMPPICTPLLKTKKKLESQKVFPIVQGEGHHVMVLVCHVISHGHVINGYSIL